MISTSGLTKTFSGPAGDVEVLRGIDISVAEGEMVAIVGASGVGKSTLLHILGTLEKPSTGSVLYGTTDVSELTEQELTKFRNQKIGFVFQFHHLMPEFSALENTVMPALIGGASFQEAQERGTALLEELGVGHRALHRPGELSGGEQQRVAVARALMLEPKVVLADEPTGNLDTSTGENLFDLLRHINEKHRTTFLIATHNEALAGRCHRVLQMRDGRISA